MEIFIFSISCHTKEFCGNHCPIQKTPYTRLYFNKSIFERSLSQIPTKQEKTNYNQLTNTLKHL